jgi:hypothetical protein
MPNVIMPNVIMLSVVKLNVIKLNVVILSVIMLRFWRLEGSYANLFISASNCNRKSFITLTSCASTINLFIDVINPMP